VADKIDPADAFIDRIQHLLPVLAFFQTGGCFVQHGGTTKSGCRYDKLIYQASGLLTELVLLEEIEPAADEEKLFFPARRGCGFIGDDFVNAGLGLLNGLDGNSADMDIREDISGAIQTAEPAVADRITIGRYEFGWIGRL